MLTTAAGSIRPAKVLIIGVGVAGLQAIATAKRLGAQVSAYDVRPDTKEQTESLGAKFVDTGVRAIGEGGYARELTIEEKTKQQEVLISSKNITTLTSILESFCATRLASSTFFLRSSAVRDPCMLMSKNVCSNFESANQVISSCVVSASIIVAKCEGMGSNRGLRLSQASCIKSHMTRLASSLLY